MIIVSNATSLIALASINAFGLLQPHFGKITISEAVYRKVVIEGKGKPGEKEVTDADWIEIRAVSDRGAVERLIRTFHLEDGEREAIILAQELSAARVILDERAARRCAAARQLGVIGTVGILLAAKAQQLIPSVKERLSALIAAGFYVDPDTSRHVLR